MAKLFNVTARILACLALVLAMSAAAPGGPCRGRPDGRFRFPVRDHGGDATAIGLPWLVLHQVRGLSRTALTWGVTLSLRTPLRDGVDPGCANVTPPT